MPSSLPIPIGPASPSMLALPIMPPAAARQPTPDMPLSQQHLVQRQTAFAALKPLTTQLLPLRAQPDRLQPVLRSLADVMGELPPAGLEGCWDYVAFPLMMLVDSIAPSRQQQQQKGGGGEAAPAAASSAPQDVVAPACRSDRVAEALLDAVLALLRRCPPRDSGQLLPVLQHLAPALQLPRAAASEEVHVRLLSCVAAALAHAAAAGEAAAATCSSSGRRGLGGAEGAGPGGGGEGAAGGTTVLECGAALCSESGAPLAGYLVHCSLEAAEREVMAGHQGSKALCAAALSALRSLLAALPDPDTLAFFLPGVVSGLSKQLLTAGALASRSGPSAPPGAAATCEALACLEVVCRGALADTLAAHILGDQELVLAPAGAAGGSALVLGGGSSSSSAASAGPGAVVVQPRGTGSGGGSAGISGAADALSALRALSAAASGSPAATRGDAEPSSASNPTLGATAQGTGQPGPNAGKQQGQQQQQPGQARRLRVTRTPEWLRDTAERMNGLLARALPPLCSHPRPAVRAALAATCRRLLDGCGRALAPSQPLLLRLLFTLAQDEWAQVSEPALEWVRAKAPLAVPAAQQGTTSGASSSSAPTAQGGIVLSPFGASSGTGAAVTKAGGEVQQQEQQQQQQEQPRSSGEAARAALEAEFHSFMASLTADSVLLEAPDLDFELDLGLDGGAEGEQAGEGGSRRQAGARGRSEDDVSQPGGRDQGPGPGVEGQGMQGGAREGLAHEATTPVSAGGAGGSAAAATAAGVAAVPTGVREQEEAEVVAAALPGLRQLVGDMAAGLLRAVRGGEAEAVVAARCLTTALLVAGPASTAEWLLLRPAALSELLGCLFRCFTFDRNAAPLVLHVRGEPGTHAPVVATTIDGGATGPASGDLDQGDKTPGRGPASGAAAVVASGSAVELPRMPLGLLHLASPRSYGAVAGVARCVGYLARAADLRAVQSEEQQGHRQQQQQEEQRRQRGLTGGFLGERGGGGGGGVVRRLVGELLSSLQEAMRVGGDSGGGGEGVGTARGEERWREHVGGSWQCDAAAVVAVTAEVLFGASNAWSPPLELGPKATAGPPGDSDGNTSGTSLGRCTTFPEKDLPYESLVLSVLEELLCPRIAQAVTHNAATSSSSGSSGSSELLPTGRAPRQLSYEEVVRPESAVPPRALSVQALGENVLVLRAALEAVGGVARAVGPRFAASGRLLRTVLVPLLERLSDPATPVAASAAAALSSICSHCGYGGSLRALLASNADYVVDALCSRLRHLQRHPRAPQLLAALLRRAGVAPELLPLMAEPLQRALQGTSILARHWAPHHVQPYLDVLRELAAGAAAEVAAAAGESREAVTELNRRAVVERDRRLAEKELADSLLAGAGEGTGSGEAQGNTDTTQASKYFSSVAAKRAAAAGRPSGIDLKGGSVAEAALGGQDGEGQDAQEDQPPLLVLSAAELDEGERRFRRLHAAAVVSGTAAEAATPLLMSAELRTAVAAAEVLRGALAGLAAATPSVEAEAQVLEEYGGPEARMRPVRPETPRLLPAVAAAWSPLMAVLRDARTPVVEGGLQLLAELVRAAGGQFLARRFQAEAWPVLQRLLAHGSAHTPGLLTLGTEHLRQQQQNQHPAIEGGSGSGAAGGLAPGAVQRVRLGVLGCLQAVCTCRSATSAVRTLTWAIAQAALPYLGSSHPPVLHEAARGVLLAVAALDPDGVWLLLYDTTYNAPPSTPLAALPSGGAAATSPPSPGTPPGLLQGVPRPPGPGFPSLQALLPVLPGAGGRGRWSASGAAGAGGGGKQWPVTASLAADCGARAALLLPAVQGMDVPWHRRAEGRA